MRILLNDGPACGQAHEVRDKCQALHLGMVNPDRADYLIRMADGRLRIRIVSLERAETVEEWLNDETGEWEEGPPQFVQLTYRRTDRVTPDGLPVFDYQASR